MYWGIPENLHKLSQAYKEFLSKNEKIGSHHPCSVDGTELGHFMLLFCKGQQRNIQKVIMHVRSYCFAH